MKLIEVMRLKVKEDFPSLPEVSVRLDEMGAGHPIETLNWKDYEYRPEVRFNIGYGDKELYLKYYVRESCVKAEKGAPNEMVCEDSCVEFFVSPSDDGLYYNLEVNPIGTVLLGTGHGRHDSTRADQEHISRIRRLTTMGLEPFSEIKGDISWTITLAIPLETFFHHNIRDFKDKVFRANFYKCGDKLSKPHFVTWSPVVTSKPDYHRPEFFGTLVFV